MARQAHLKYGPASRDWSRGNLSAIRFNDRLTDGKAKTHASLFRRPEGVKEVLTSSRRQTGAGIGHRENDRIPSILRGGNSQTTLGQCAVRHRLGRIEDEIADDLLDLDPIGKNAR